MKNPLFSNHRVVSYPQSGFTLTELAIVLGIMGLILGAIWAAASKVYFNQKVTKAVTQTLAIAEGIKNAFPNGSASAAPLTAFVINSGLAPSDMIQSCTGLPLSNGASYSNGTSCMVGPFQNQVIAGSQEGFYGVATTSRQFDIGLQTSVSNPTQTNAFLAALVPAAVNDGLVTVWCNGNTIAVNSNTSPTAFSACDMSGGLMLIFNF